MIVRRFEITPRGSAPRVRGTPPKNASRPGAPRFSPARAGNTRFTCPRWRGGPVQPRACGEHSIAWHAPALPDGSAPRVRGTQRMQTTAQGRGRFSPARAGNTRLCNSVEYGGPVQPRACGEHGKGEKVIPTSIGSAPRVRGTRHAAAAQADHPRFSPARAGNTMVARCHARHQSVQPRACGEHNSCHGIKIVDSGSAPRVRGTLHRYRKLNLTARFSPARAGNTLPKNPI